MHATLDNNFKKGQTPLDIPTFNIMQVQRVTVDILYWIINRFLFGTTYLALDKLGHDYRMSDRLNWHKWMVWVLIENEPLWVRNTNEKIKKFLSFIVKFWWAVVWLCFIPTGRDNVLDNDRAIIVASIIFGFKLNFVITIADEM